MTKANTFFSDPLVAKIATVVNKSLPDKPDTRLLAATRRARISELLRIKGAVRVAELSAALGVSEVTIRGDLQLMAEQGLLVRDRGGAIAQVTTATSTTLVERSRQNPEAKIRIAKAAAAMVESGQTILLDAGSTV
ncbi:MAG TPA: DeoR family transcriptional regulator, partial [Tepidisphaeraceae bacterium]|nr:DeoR family transcriptional regulator [Tepidisphaeraceae bacterium]